MDEGNRNRLSANWTSVLHSPAQGLSSSVCAEFWVWHTLAESPWPLSDLHRHSFSPLWIEKLLEEISSCWLRLAFPAWWLCPLGWCAFMRFQSMWFQSGKQWPVLCMAANLTKCTVVTVYTKCVRCSAPSGLVQHATCVQSRSLTWSRWHAACHLDCAFGRTCISVNMCCTESTVSWFVDCTWHYLNAQAPAVPAIHPAGTCIGLQGPSMCRMEEGVHWCRHPSGSGYIFVSAPASCLFYTGNVWGEYRRVWLTS